MSMCRQPAEVPCIRSCQTGFMHDQVLSGMGGGIGQVSELWDEAAGLSSPGCL